MLALPVLVVLDEAYIEFADEPSKISWVTRYPNLIVLRTFSKSAGACLSARKRLVSRRAAAGQQPEAA